MIKWEDIIEFPYNEIKIGNYVKETKIININYPVLTTIRKNKGDIEELIFAILKTEKEGMRDLSCTAILPVVEENENYERYREILNS